MYGQSALVEPIAAVLGLLLHFHTNFTLCFGFAGAMIFVGRRSNSRDATG
jgi:hypothetical protein